MLLHRKGRARDGRLEEAEVFTLGENVVELEIGSISNWPAGSVEKAKARLDEILTDRRVKGWYPAEKQPPVPALRQSSAVSASNPELEAKILASENDGPPFAF